MTDILRSLWIPALGVVVLLGLIGRSLWTATARAQSDAPAVAASPAPKRVAADGRLVARPGAEVTLGSDLDGTVARVAVEEKDHVRRGQVLIELRADDIKASLAEAKARIAEADADIRLATTEVERAITLAYTTGGTAATPADYGVAPASPLSPPFSQRYPSNQRNHFPPDKPMSLFDALLLDPYRINVWIAYRTDGVKGTGTQADPWDGSTNHAAAVTISGLTNAGLEATATTAPRTVTPTTTLLPLMFKPTPPAGAALS